MPGKPELLQKECQSHRRHPDRTSDPVLRWYPCLLYTSQVFAYATASAALSEIREHESGMVISGYHLKDMYYTELADSLPPHFELVLLGSASTVSAADTGILSLTTPLKVYDLVNTAEMVLHQMERMAKKARKPKRRSEREDNYIKNAKVLLMERNHLSEEEAHRYIQKSSMDNGTNMVAVSYTHLDVYKRQARQQSGRIERTEDPEQTCGRIR